MPGRDLIDSQVLARLRALPFFSRKPMQGPGSGAHRSALRGSSVEFSQYRKYVEGDDIRRLDWKAYARSDRYYVKEFEADSNLRAYFVIDCSGSMAIESGAPLSTSNAHEGSEKSTKTTKLDYAKRIAATLSYLLIEQNDAAGLARASSLTQSSLPAGRSPTHLQAIYEALEDTESKGKTTLPQAIHELAEQLEERAQVILISDLFFELEELREALSHLRFKKHDVSILHLLDRREIDFDFERPQRFEDLEDGSALLVDPVEIAEHYQLCFQQYLSEVRSLTQGQDVHYQRVVLDEPLEQTLAQFLLFRTRRKQ